MYHQQYQYGRTPQPVYNTPSYSQPYQPQPSYPGQQQSYGQQPQQMQYSPSPSQYQSANAPARTYQSQQPSSTVNNSHISQRSVYDYQGSASQPSPSNYQQQQQQQQGQRATMVDTRASYDHLATPPPPPSQSPSQRVVPDYEKDRLKTRVDELQGLVERQASDLQRRNEELLDLQRNHEAFREKFILFREGIRTKTEESDASYRKMEGELKLANEDLASKREQLSRQPVADAMRQRVVDLEYQVEKLRGSNRQLEEDLAGARKQAQAPQQGNDGKEELIRDLQSRLANQAEFIRTNTTRVAELEARLRQEEESSSSHGNAAQELAALQMKYRDMEQRAAGQAASLNGQALKVMELSTQLEEEQRASAAQRAQLHSLSSSARAMEGDADGRKAAGERLEREVREVKGELEQARQREAGLQARLMQTQQDRKALPAALQEAQAESNRLRGEKEQAERLAYQKEQQVQQMQASLASMQDEALRAKQALQHESSVLMGRRESMQQEITGLRAQLAAMANVQAEASHKQGLLEQAEHRVRELEGEAREASSTITFLQDQNKLARPAPLQAQPESELRTRMLHTRDLLLGKLIGNWQKQTLGRSFAAWLRSIEALKMDRILAESDKYMSMDSSIDDLLNDALSKRRARSIVASSVSLGGSSIDDEVFQAVAARPVSGGSVASFGNSSVSGSLEWMV